MARNLEADRAMLATVLTHAQNRDIRRAAAIAEQALAEGFEHPLLLNVVATRLEEQGKLDEAVRLLERAVALAPGDVPARNALALCLQRVDRPADALSHVEVLLKSHPELGFAHANKGNALIALGSLGLARTSHLRALEPDPPPPSRPWAPSPRPPRTGASTPRRGAGRSSCSRGSPVSPTPC